MNYDNHLEGVLTYTHTHTFNEVMNHMGYFQGRYSSWLGIKFLEQPYYSYSIKKGKFWVNTLLKLR